MQPDGGRVTGCRSIANALDVTRHSAFESIRKSRPNFRHATRLLVQACKSGRLARSFQISTDVLISARRLNSVRMISFLCK